MLDAIAEALNMRRNVVFKYTDEYGDLAKSGRIVANSVVLTADDITATAEVSTYINGEHVQVDVPHADIIKHTGMPMHENPDDALQEIRKQLEAAPGIGGNFNFDRSQYEIFEIRFNHHYLVEPSVYLHGRNNLNREVAIPPYVFINDGG